MRTKDLPICLRALQYHRSLSTFSRESFIAGTPDTEVMAGAETLRCNICGMLLTSAQISKHAGTSSHASLKSKLVGDLEKVGKAHYEADSSVILRWKDSLRA